MASRSTYPDNGQSEVDVLRMIAVGLAKEDPWHNPEGVRKCRYCDRFHDEQHNDYCIWKLAQPYGEGRKK